MIRTPVGSCTERDHLGKKRERELTLTRRQAPRGGPRVLAYLREEER
jgi:hypothetical protein